MEILSAVDIAQTLMNDIGFSAEAMKSVPGRLEEVRRILTQNGFALEVDPSAEIYVARPVPRT